MTCNRFWVVICGCMMGVMAMSSAAEAQGQAPAATPAPAPTAAPPPAAAQALCVPQCRAGYFCHDGQCLSRCNPACNPGQICTDAGSCVAEPTAAVPVAAPTPVFVEAPLDARSARELRREQIRAQREERRQRLEERRAVERKKQQEALDRDGYHGRFYIGPHVTLQGKGLADSQKFSTHSQFGLDAGYEVRSTVRFGFGPAFRLQRISYRDSTIADISIRPTLHFPLGMVEVIVPFSFGLALGWDGETRGGDGPFATDGIGIALDVMPGLIFWPTRGFGLYANLGLTGHMMYMRDFVRYYTTAVNVGVAISH